MNLDYQHILAAVNPHKNNQNALEKGLTLARRANAKLTLLMICAPNSPSTSELNQQLDDIERCSQQAKKDGLDVILKQVQHKHDYKAVLEELNEQRYDLVIKERDAKHHNYLGIATCDDWHLLRDIQTPVLLVTSKAWQAHGHILTAIDTERDNESHQQLNQHLINTSCYMAKLLDSNAHFLNCYLGEHTSVSIEEPSDNVEMSEKRQHWHHLVELIRGNQQVNNIPKKLHLRCGIVEDEIAALAYQYEVNMVLLGTTERQSLVNTMLGHTSEYIIEKLDYDVLAIKPDNDWG
ncbi:universal stress protein [Thalassotalea ganghwensis]